MDRAVPEGRASTEPPPAVGVVVVHHGDSGPTLRCLRSVLSDPSPAERRVVVVDNSAETPGGLADRDLPAGVERLPAPENPGFGAGANRGVEHLRGGWGDAPPPAAWVILNHDTELLPGFLAAAAEAVSEPGVGAAGGPLTLDRPDGPLWYAGGGFRRITGTVRQSRSAADARTRREVRFIPGTALAVAPAAWRDVGGFDPGFFLYHEDLDLCLRLRRSGWRLRFAPGMAAVHAMGAATGSRERSSLYLEHMTRTRFRPHPSRLYRAYLAGVHTPWVALRALRLLLRDGRRALPAVRALLRGHRAALGTVLRVERPGGSSGKERA